MSSSCTSCDERCLEVFGVNFLTYIRNNSDKSAIELGRILSEKLDMAIARQLVSYHAEKNGIKLNTNGKKNARRAAPRKAQLMELFGCENESELLLVGARKAAIKSKTIGFPTSTVYTMFRNLAKRHCRIFVVDRNEIEKRDDGFYLDGKKIIKKEFINVPKGKIRCYILDE